MDIGRDEEAEYEIAEYCGRLSCRKPIVQTAGRGRRREFCSETCRRGADREYKRARAMVDLSARNLRAFRHEAAAYGRRAEEGDSTPEQEQAQLLLAASVLSRAKAALEFGADDGSPYREELRKLAHAIDPLMARESTRLSA